MSERSKRTCLCLLFAFSLYAASLTCANELASTADVEFFEKKIRPVLVQHCYKCHATDSKKIRGGLLLDTRAAIRTGGDSGPGIVPSNPDESLILDALRHESFEMPPSGQLSDEVIADFEKWIQRGAVDPRDGIIRQVQSELDIEDGKKFWAFQPLGDTRLPDVKDTNWPETSLDCFVLSRLEREGIEPVGDADRVTLIRRAYFALIGLPPTPAEIDGYLANPEPTSAAFARVVDRLLESKRFGERWGRHWLDVVRFAESSGGGRTLLFPNAWRYRDYVIEAFNRDLPYDQFLREQLAGDLMDSDTWQQHRRQIVATSFLVLGPTNYELQDKDALEMDIVDEQIDTMGKAFLGMTLGCVRCHDHKFDPIPTSDYYALAGIFKSTKSVIHSNVSAWNTTKLPLPAEAESALQAHERLVADLKRELNAAKQELKNANGDQHRKSIDPKALQGVVVDDLIPQSERPAALATADAKKRDDELVAATKQRTAQLEKKLKDVQSSGPSRPVAMAVTDEEEVADIHVAIRGMVHNKGEVVPRGALQAASWDAFAEIPPNESGRAQLAEWISHRKNPLTARVIVNRVWYWLFGEGLVRTVDNFGAMGEAPSHPELLDHLAEQFIQDGWSVKTLIRKIMLSRVYKLGSTQHARAVAMDPSNRLLWRMNRQRMDAESIRDTLLHIGGQLDLELGGPNIKPGTKIEYEYQFDSKRRSVYLPVFRNTLPEIFSNFDFADPNVQGGKRTTSTIAPQALLLLNHPFVIEQSRSAAKGLCKHNLSIDDGIQNCYRQVLGRHPSAVEHELAANFIGSGSLERWSLLYQALFQSLDFRYLN